LKRDYESRHRSHKQNLSQPAAGERADPGDRQIQLPLDRDELLELMQYSLESLALELGLLVNSREAVTSNWSRKREGWKL